MFKCLYYICLLKVGCKALNVYLTPLDYFFFLIYIYLHTHVNFMETQYKDQVYGSSIKFHFLLVIMDC